MSFAMMTAETISQQYEFPQDFAPSIVELIIQSTDSYEKKDQMFLQLKSLFDLVSFQRNGNTVDTRCSDEEFASKLITFVKQFKNTSLYKLLIEKTSVDTVMQLLDKRRYIITDKIYPIPYNQEVMAVMDMWNKRMGKITSFLKNEIESLDTEA